MLPPFVILPLIFGSIRPALLPKTMLLVLKPLSFVLCAVHVCVGSLPVSLVIQPVSLVSVPVSVIKLPVPSRPILFVVPLIARSIGPLLHTEAVSRVANPLSSVNSTIRESDRRFLDPRDLVHAHLLLSLLFSCAVSLKIIIEHSLISHFIFRIEIAHLYM
jgi:hypothetical protein